MLDRNPGDGRSRQTDPARDSVERTASSLAQARRVSTGQELCADAGRALLEARETAVSTVELARRQLRECIEEYAATLYAQGVPPERALVMVKEAARAATSGAAARPDHTLADDVVRWCIDAFYAADHRGRAD